MITDREILEHWCDVNRRVFGKHSMIIFNRMFDYTKTVRSIEEINKCIIDAVFESKPYDIMEYELMLISGAFDNNTTLIDTAISNGASHKRLAAFMGAFKCNMLFEEVLSLEDKAMLICIMITCKKFKSDIINQYLSRVEYRNLSRTYTELIAKYIGISGKLSDYDKWLDSRQELYIHVALGALEVNNIDCYNICYLRCNEADRAYLDSLDNEVESISHNNKYFWFYILMMFMLWIYVASKTGFKC